MLMCFELANVSATSKWDLSKIDDGKNEADYEVQVKNSNGKEFIAYIVEEGDIFVKRKCRCIAGNLCSTGNAIKLSK